jgi:outer membrane protein
MKKIILVAAVALMSFAAKAQDLKFAYVDFNEVVMLMPEMDEARATLEENSKTNDEIMMAMYEEYQTKMQQYEQKSSTWTPAVLETKQRELMEI